MEKLSKINYAIIGNGNLGKAIQKQALPRQNEFNLVGTFSRREVEGTIPYNELGNFKDKIDVALFCGGSSNDAPVMVPEINAMGISTVDSYDNHGELKNQNYQTLISNAIESSWPHSNSTAIIGAGWDPGYLTLMRQLNSAVIPNGIHHTFYGGNNGGMSMGHTNAIKQIPGVKKAIQLTITRDDAVEEAKIRQVAKNDRHLRDCYVVADEIDHNRIELAIRIMPDYFKDQLVNVTFLTEDEFDEKFAGFTAHGGRQISSNGIITADASIQTQSNMDLTANVMLAYAKANKKMQLKNMYGAFTIDEVPLAYTTDEDTRLNNL